MQSYKSYFDFIRYSIRSNQSEPDSVEIVDWAAFYAFCLRQGIAGVVFDGLERYGKKIPQHVLYKWVETVEAIKVTNRLVDKRCQQLSRYWEKQGYLSCILKGQANAIMYPRPELRSPGDIDIWVTKKTQKSRKQSDSVEEIIRIAQRTDPNGHYSFHHVTMPVFKGTSVEVHYRPIFLDNWWKDKCLQRYIDEIKDAQFENSLTLGDGKSKICGLTDEFNAVFLLLHMWHHLLSTRNNFKQLVDYYYLLKRGNANHIYLTRLFNQLGVLKYARGLMWIMHEVLGLENQYLLVEPDEEIGQLLLNETLHYGEKNERTKIGELFGRITDNAHLFQYFPVPVLIAPVYLVWHQWWKLRMKMRLNRNSNV